MIPFRSELEMAVRELLDELNVHSAAGLITHRALVLMNRVEQILAKER